ncbi:MAG: PIN domain-containing protein [Gemmatimonadetes bacterium]|nr:PIN domain-containing protein [Gemmatimonadota bacterium]
MVLFLRRARPPSQEGAALAARRELRAGQALVSVVTAAELLLGARSPAESENLGELIDRLPVVAADREVSELSARLGAYVRRRGATIPLMDLVIAATALWLDLPLLTCDSDFDRGRRLAEGRDDGDEGARLWRSLMIHPASVF